MIIKPFSGDIDQLVNLINSAYRGESSRLGWTTEADILEGKRCDRQMIQNILLDNNQVILCAFIEENLLGCVHVAKDVDAAQLGMYAVNPKHQGQGIGNALMNKAEEYAKEHFASSIMRMGIINKRLDILPFYERRGYRDTKRRESFPVNSLWQPKVESLELLVFEKSL